MGMKELEKAIVAELRTVTGNNKLKEKDMMEWRTGKDSIKAESGETLYYLPVLHVSVAIKSTEEP